MYVDETAWIVAATGSARNAPIGPKTAPNAITARNAIAGLISSDRGETLGEKIRFSTCWYPTMNASVSRPLTGSTASATAMGSAPPMYVPMVGTNCETTPVNAASGSAYGMPRIVRKMNVKNVDSAASTMRELMKSATFSCETSHRRSTSRCRAGASIRQIAARSFGPALAM